MRGFPLVFFASGCLLLADPPPGVSTGLGAVGLTPEGKPTQVAVSYEAACALYENGATACAHDSWTDRPTVELIGIFGGYYGWCGIGTQTELFCTTHDKAPEEATAVALGESTGCAIEPSGGVACWGDNDGGIADPPSSIKGATRIAMGWENGCAVDASGHVTCWGDDFFGVRDDSPSGTFLDVAVAEFTACAIVESDGSVKCWGSSPMKPKGTGYTRIVAGDYHFCALADDGSVDCWGDDDAQQASPPSDTFTSLAAAGYASCGITEAGEVRCWGDGIATGL